MEKLIDHLARHSRLELLLIIFAVSQIALIVIDNLIFFIDPVSHAESRSYQIEYFLSNQLIYSLLIVVLVAPIIETLIFQIFLLLALKRLTKCILGSDNWFPSLILTTLTFSAVHGLEYANLYYWFINASIRLPISFCFAFIAIIEYEKERGRPILSVFLFHAFHNAIESIYVISSTE